jgi:hypothetical protein
MLDGLSNIDRPLHLHIAIQVLYGHEQHTHSTTSANASSALDSSGRAIQ